MIKQTIGWLGFVAATCLMVQAGERPNVLVIVSDDAGYADFGFQGCKDFPTPHIDQLAKSGVRLTQGYVNGPVCSPSRAALLTGKHPAHIGHENNLGGDKGGVDVASALIPARMKSLGYVTGGIGKWHLGWRDEYLPWKRGFDEWIGFLGGGSDYLPSSKSGKIKLTRNGQEVGETEYLTDALTREATTFIEKHAQTKKSDTPPWFLYLAYNAVHSPMQAPIGGEEKYPQLPDKKRRTLAAMTESLDNGVGKVIDKLSKTGQLDNTMVVFINDNGGATYAPFYNTPLRGHKGTLFEGGIRVPFIVSWPGTLAAGKEYTAPATAIDLMPTFMAAGGAKKDAYADGDGVNLLPYLQGSAQGVPHEYLFWRFNVAAVARKGDYKLIRIRDNDPLLFDLSKDVAEANNIAGQHPDLVKSLLEKLSAWEKPFPEPKWTEGDKWEASHIKDHIKPAVYQGPNRKHAEQKEMNDTN